MREAFLMVTLATACGGAERSAGPSGVTPHVGDVEADAPADMAMLDCSGMMAEGQWVARRVTLPKSSQDYRYDANGSGPKNQFGNLIAGLSLMADPQANTDGAVASGEL